jgi:Sulfotransferase family
VSERPIYVGGLAHSGKTPLRAALGAHPDVSMTRKTRLWDRFHGRFGDLSVPSNLDRCLAQLLADPAVRRLDPDEARIRRELVAGPVTDARVFGLLQAHHAERLGRSRWGEQVKSIERFADPIFTAFPDARMIHMIRDPRARFGASVHRGPGAVGWQTAMWRGSVELAERNLGRYPQGYLVIRFEELAGDPARTLDAICGFAGLHATNEMRDVLVAGLPEEAADPTTPAQRAFVERYAGPVLPAYGYETAPVTGVKDRAVAAMTRPLNRAAMAAWRLTAGRTTEQAVRG